MITTDEKLALLTVIDKTVKRELDEAKLKARQQLLELAEQGLADRKPILVNGQKVGEVGASYAKPKPVIIDEVQALKFLQEHGLTVQQPVAGWEKFFAKAGDVVVFTDSGEVANGIQWEEARPKGATVRVPDNQAVIDAFGERLTGQSIDTLLLGSNSLLLEGSE